VIYRGGGLVGWWGRFVGGGWRGGGGGGRMRDLYLGEERENEVFVEKIDEFASDLWGLMVGSQIAILDGFGLVLRVFGVGGGNKGTTVDVIHNVESWRFQNKNGRDGIVCGKGSGMKGRSGG